MIKVKNTSGIFPLEYRVLVKPVKVQEKTEGGIIIPEQAKDKQKYAIEKGRLIAVGSNAFEDPAWGFRPEVGQMILFDRYAGGRLVKGMDGEEYRLMNDKEITAIVSEEF